MKEFEFLRHETDRTKKSHACVTLYHKLYDKELKSEIFISSYDKDNHVNMDVDLSFELKFDNNMYKYNYKPTDDSIDMYHRLQRCIPKKHFNLEKEIELVKKLSQFPEIVLNSYKNLNPAIIANYSYQLAQIFNEFYHSCPVIGNKKQNFRLHLVEAFRIVLKNSLSLLGIESLEEM